MNNPKVSVIMSCYKEIDSEVNQAIQSILSQTFKDFEFIIILDNPESLALKKLLEDWVDKDSRIKLIVHPKNQGLAVGRNTGVSQSRGGYVAMMDADDIAKEDRLEKQFKHFQEHNCDLVFSQMEYIDDIGKTFGFLKPKYVESKIKSQIFTGSLFGHPTAMIKKEVLQEYKYDENFLRSQDLDLWLRLILAKKKFCIIDEPLLKYRIHHNVSIEDRISRQRGYANYGVKIFFKHFKSFWTLPAFWFFGFKKMGYFLILSLPMSLLNFLIKIKDFLKSCRK